MRDCSPSKSIFVAAAGAAAAATKIDFDGLQSRIVSVAGVPERQYSLLKAGAGGTVYFLEASAGAPPGAGGTLQRFKLTERKATAFATGVADYAVSADGKKLVDRAAAPPAPPAAP